MMASRRVELASKVCALHPQRLQLAPQNLVLRHGRVVMRLNHANVVRLPLVLGDRFDSRSVSVSRTQS